MAVYTTKHIPFATVGGAGRGFADSWMSGLRWVGFVPCGTWVVWQLICLRLEACFVADILRGCSYIELAQAGAFVALGLHTAKSNMPAQGIGH